MKTKIVVIRQWGKVASAKLAIDDGRIDYALEPLWSLTISGKASGFGPECHSQLAEWEKGESMPLEIRAELEGALVAAMEADQQELLDAEATTRRYQEVGTEDQP